MNLKGVAPGYIYILSNEFPPEQMITITTSRHGPEEFQQMMEVSAQTSQWILENPLQILHSRYLENSNLIEGKIHEFLVNADFSGGTPKDYQLSFKDGLYLLDKVVFEKYLEPGECLKNISHTDVVPPESCNYFLLGTLFNGTYGAGDSSNHLYSKDEGVAFQCFKKGADLGDERCLLELGRCYEYGIAIEKDYKRALEKYRELFAASPSSGVNALFRLHLRRGEYLKAGGVVDTFVDFCEKEAQLPNHSSSKDQDSKEHSVERVLENHQQFVTILGELIWDSYQLEGDWGMLEGYWDIFEEFSFSICAYLEKQSKMMHESQFMEESQKLEKCLREFSDASSPDCRNETG